MNIEVLNKLTAELAKDKYTGTTDEEALELLKTGESVLGRIEGDNRRNLITLINTGLRRRLLANEKAAQELVDEFEVSPDFDAEDAVYKQNLQLLALVQMFVDTLEPVLVMQPDFSINLGDAEVYAAFNAGYNAGLITEAEHARVLELATYTKPTEFMFVSLEQVKIVRQGLVGEALVNVDYGDGLAQLVVDTDSRVSVNISLDAPAEFDTAFDVRFKGTNEDKDVDENYKFVPVRFSAMIPKGDDSVQLMVNPRELNRFTRVVVETELTTPLTVKVRKV